MMQAMIIEQLGSSAVFSQKKIAIPSLLPGYVLVEVKASSINPLDVKIRNSSLGHLCPPFPAILHGDVAGVITAVGADVQQFKVGDEIYGCAGGVGSLQGALAEYMLVDADLIALKPKNLTMKQAATLPLVSLTAWLALMTRAQLKKNESVCIYGGTGGVGHVAIQLAKTLGAVVTTTCGSDDKIPLVKQLGADYVANYKSNSLEERLLQSTQGEGFDVVFDTLGGPMLDLAFKIAKLEGCVATLVIDSAHDLMPFYIKGLTLSAVMQPLPLLTGNNRKTYHHILSQITQLVEQDQIKPLLDKQEFGFSDIATAHDYSEKGTSLGKIALLNDLS